ncbi:unnamed protein product, partial [Phaeothamnion confervicola]
EREPSRPHKRHRGSCWRSCAVGDPGLHHCMGSETEDPKRTSASLEMPPNEAAATTMSDSFLIASTPEVASEVVTAAPARSLASNYLLGLLVAIVVCLFADQALLAPNLSRVASDFGFSDKEKDQKLGGQLALAFFSVGAVASLLVGWLTDSLDRRIIFAIIVFVGEGASLCIIFVHTFYQLLVLRALAGIAVGGALPLVFSMLGDLVGASERSAVCGWLGVSIGLGSALGQAIGGTFGHGTAIEWQEERLPFAMVAAPCLLFALLLLTTTRDPQRGRHEEGLQSHLAEGGDYAEKITLEGVRTLCSTPSVLLVFAQGIPGCVPWGVVGTYMNDFLQRQKGLSVTAASFVIFLFGIGGVIGAIIGGPLGSYLYQRGKWLPPLLMGATTLLAIPPCLVLLDDAAKGLAVHGAASLAGGCMASITGPNVRALLINVTVPVTRGTAFGVFNLFDDVGKGLGPVYVSLLIAQVGRREAFTIALNFWVACGIFLALTALTVNRDEDRVQAHLKDYAAKAYDQLSPGGKLASARPISSFRSARSAAELEAAASGRPHNGVSGGGSGSSSSSFG